MSPIWCKKEASDIYLVYATNNTWGYLHSCLVIAPNDTYEIEEVDTKDCAGPDLSKVDVSFLTQTTILIFFSVSCR